MNIVALGASGKVGREVVNQALRRATVTAFVRDASKVSGIPATVVTGDARNAADLARAMDGADAVISALGSSKPSESLIEPSTKAVLDAMSEAHVKRVVMMSSFTASPDYKPTGIMKLLGGLMKGMVADRNAGEDLLRRSDRDSTIVDATRLKNGPRAGYEFISGRIPSGASITRADVTDALLATLSDPASIRQTSTVAGRE